MVEEAVVSELKRQLEDEDLNLEQKVSLLNDGLNSETTTIIPVCLSVSVTCLSTLHTISSSVFLCLLAVQMKCFHCRLI